MTSRQQQELRERVLAAPVVAPPPPWRRPANAYPYLPIGGLVGVGFGTHPDDGRDLLMIVSHNGHGVVDTRDYAKLARDRDPEPDDALPAGDDLSVRGLGPLAGRRLRIAGLYGGGLHTVTGEGWTVEVAAPDWPTHRVLLSSDGGLYDGAPGTSWWHIFHAHYSELYVSLLNLRVDAAHAKDGHAWMAGVLGAARARGRRRPESGSGRMGGPSGAGGGGGHTCR